MTRFAVSRFLFFWACGLLFATVSGIMTKFSMGTGKDECIHGDPPTPCRNCNPKGDKEDAYL